MRLEHQTDLEVPLLDVNYGAGDRTQVKFEIPYVLQSDHRNLRAGLGNSKLGLKWRFVDEETRGIAVSVYPQFTFNNPTCSVRRGLAEDGWQLLVPTEVSKRFAKFEVDAELGYNVQQRRANQVWMGFIGAYRKSERVELLAEVHSILVPNRTAKNESVFDLGTRIRVTGINRLLLAAGRGLPGSTHPRPAFFFYSGIQFAF